MGTRILLVDDQHSIRSYFKRLLAPLQAEITEAENGETALALASRHAFDVVVTDVDMPRMNGVDLCRRL